MVGVAGVGTLWFGGLDLSDAGFVLVRPFGIGPFDRLVDQVMTTEPCATARRVFWVLDSSSSHRGQASIDRLQHRWPKLRLIHLPVHASWLNQVEIYFRRAT